MVIRFDLPYADQNVILTLPHVLSEELISGLNISCKFDVDAMRPTSRGFFGKTDRKARTHIVTYELRNTKEDTCFTYSIYMPVR